MKRIIFINFIVFLCFSASVFAQIPVKTLVEIVKAEDELRFDSTLINLLKSTDAKIRTRAALASGRIGNDAAISALITLLEKDSSAEVRVMAMFAIGEIESIKGADAILKILRDTKNTDPLRARAVESAGKIAAANAKDAKATLLGEAILEVLEFEDKRGAKLQNRDVILFGITAALRVRPEKTDLSVAKFLTNFDARIRADAGNTLARVRAKNANETFKNMLRSETDAVARANAARALGAAEDQNAVELLIKTAISDKDSRVRVAAIRSLGSLKNAKSADSLLKQGETLLASFKKSKFASPNEKNELLEIATTFGRILPNSNDEKAVKFLQSLREADKFHSSETEIAFARIAPEKYLKIFNSTNNGLSDWRTASSYAQGLGEIANQSNETIKKQGGEKITAYFGDIIEKTPTANQLEINKAVPDLLRATATYKSDILPILLREMINTKDVFIRAAAAELLGDAESNTENISALNDAFLKTNEDKFNDAALAILDTLEKYYKKSSKIDRAAVSILKTFEAALSSSDYLVRRKTIAILKNAELTNAVPKGFELVRFAPPKAAAPNEFRTIRADYVRAVSRKNGTVKAFFTTEKGNFTIDLTPEDAPLTVDNFIKLAKSKYFDGLAIHRVVPNFVMQDGDPRGDGNGGPGWSIRCEINMLSFERGAVGMALSGKDTGGSQWFATHSPQPHLDGGYTVFGRVNEIDMKVVDSIVRGDKILSVKITEKAKK